MAKKTAKYATVKELEALLRDMRQGISGAMIRRHINKAGIKQTPKTKKYNVEKVLDAIRQHRAEDNKNQGGEKGRLQAQKIELECEILQLKVYEMRGQVIPVSEHLGEMRAMQSIWNSTLDHFKSEAAALTKDPHLVKRLGMLVNSARLAIVARIEAAEAKSE